MKFIKQETELTVENVDPPTSFQNYRHGPLLPNTTRALIVGPSGCGKTNLMYTLLTNINGIRFHNVYIYSKTLDQPKYKIYRRNTIIYVLRKRTSIEPEKALPNSVYILDDILTERQGVCRSIFARGRHYLIDVCYLAQSYSRVPKQLLRDNANLIVLFKQDETNLKHIYMENWSGDMSYTEFKDCCTSCWRKGRFNFIVINKDCKRDDGRYRYGFDTFVII
ncbi:tigger transposable element-derived protein 4-like [Aphis craccivora]|uniref:Tigger transposable element-derived protein 4-like n=1 Tax=Aphis craccivora TaxID=307492 RepID=A0A6G0Y3B0_APHCR|nr:tigger transposable element-derived protein 4-like [Aphis craccivora]